MPPRAPRIEICGPIGAGKSTLAQAIAARTGWRLVEEQFRAVPFFAAFYAGGGYAFEKNVGFMLAHADAVRAASEPGRPFVCDYALFQNLAYADVGNVAEEVRLLEDLHRRVTGRYGPPDLLVVLDRPSTTLRERIRSRARPEEQAIDEDYLDRLRTAIAHRRRGVAAPQLEIGPVELTDPAGADAAVDAVLAALEPGPRAAAM